MIVRIEPTLWFEQIVWLKTDPTGDPGMIVEVSIRKGETEVNFHYGVQWPGRYSYHHAFELTTEKRLVQIEPDEPQGET